MSLKIKKLDENAIIPTRGSPNAAGLDLYSNESLYFAPGDRVFVRTGIAIQLHHHTYGRVAPRSGLALKHGIDVLAGVIDSDYRGEVGVMLINCGHHYCYIEKGDRIAQLIVEKIELPNVIEVEELDETERSEGGYGSTGV